MSHILDDFIFLGPGNSNACSRNLNAFLDLAQLLNIPIKHEKTVEPTTELIVHEIEIDSPKMEFRLPEDKIIKAREILQFLGRKKKVTLHELPSAIGFLQFACKAILPGRAFLRRLINLTIGVSRPGHRIRLNSAARADIALWLQFLESFNGKSLFLFDKWVSSETLQLTTDASGLGFGGSLGKKMVSRIVATTVVASQHCH